MAMNDGRRELDNSIKLLGEVFVTGASELLEGRVTSGLAHSVLAGAATLAFAGVSPVLAGAVILAIKIDSFSRSLNDRGLSAALENGRSDTGAATATLAPPPPGGAGAATATPASAPAGGAGAATATPAAAAPSGAGAAGGRLDFMRFDVSVLG
ncbi:MAG: hypothetical protein JOY66_14675 [Acetobacteraceae bacterium]|nr:hypothetical protein [Acetobacteraceae bacterium]